MGCMSSKTAPSAPHRKRALLIQARYALPVKILIQANKMTDEKVSELKASFKKFDKANKGYVDAKEVGPLMKAAKQIDSDKDVDTVILHAGVEKDDRVDFDLFVKMVLGHTRAADPEVEMRDAFRVFDVNNDGVINAEELRTVFSAMGTRLTDTEVADLVKEADLDGNGLVDYNEFIRLLVDPGEEKF